MEPGEVELHEMLDSEDGSDEDVVFEIGSASFDRSSRTCANE